MVKRTTPPRLIRLRKGQLLDKYRIERRIAEGPFTAVYQAFDTIEGIRVALKIPHPHLLARQVLEEFRQEVRVAANLDHPNILHVKNASFLDGHFVIVLPLGERTLAGRMQNRMSLRTIIGFMEQALEALDHAHSRRVIHCDIKPDNFILFPGDHLRLADFGIAKVAMRTIEASGSGTIGYIAPEQAMGRPSFKSDVFSLGLIFYRMLTGKLPAWPFDWPPPGYDRLRRRVHPDLLNLVIRAIAFEPADRFRDAGHMLAALRAIKTRALNFSRLKRRSRRGRPRRDWKDVQRRQFLREHGAALDTRYKCHRCGGPVSEPMRHCPWCGAGRAAHRGDTTFPARCPRCNRGVKLDWRYCPWCYGSGFEHVSARTFSDRRYLGRCSNSGCTRKVLMPFMRYCPWCRRSVRRKWPVPGSPHKCPACGWGILPAFWSVCPWCGKKTE